MPRHITWMILIMEAFALQGCIAFDRPQRPELAPLPEKFVSAPAVADLAITPTLLDLVDDKKATRLVAEALENNRDLLAAAQRLKASGLLLSRTASAMLPKAEAGYTGTRNSQSADRTHQVALNMSWEVSIWGRLADLHAARVEAFQGQEQSYLHAMDSLAARVLQACFTAKANQMLMNVHHERVALYDQAVQTILNRYRSGIGTLDEMAAARAKVQVARSGLARARQTLNASLRDLELLLGRYPNAAIDLPEHLSRVALPRTSVPAAVLANRPDIRAAAKNFEAALRDAGASHKALLPDITLTANMFRENARLDRLTTAPTLWGLTGSTLMPLFNAGALEHEAKAADALARAAFESYAQTVIRAMKEAEDAFYAEKILMARLSYLTAARKEALRSLAYYKARFREGLATITELHTAMDQDLGILADLIDVRVLAITNRIDLALSLGTGIQERKNKE